jgi:DNA-binding NtrC family response regulator
VVEIVVPPLRERRGDIAVLANHLLAKAARDLHRNHMRLGADAVRALEANNWPGNVRELENAVVRAVALATSSTISAADIIVDAPPAIIANPGNESNRHTLDDVEREYVERVLRDCGGNKRQACRLLGISRPRLDRILERHRIVVSDRRSE